MSWYMVAGGKNVLCGELHFLQAKLHYVVTNKFRIKCAAPLIAIDLWGRNVVLTNVS